MVLLNQVLDTALLTKMIEQNYVRIGTHPDYPELKIYTYTQSAAFDGVWNSVTNQCRGLITATVAGVERVIARGFNKFHNINTASMPETLEANLPQETPVFATKMDGSLGIIYFWDNKIHVATRGSFVSDQAQWATQWLRKQISIKAGHQSILEYLPPAMTQLYMGTLVCEIIYHENRIVVDYNFEGLVALAVLRNRDGKEVGSAPEINAGAKNIRYGLEQIAEKFGMPAVKIHTGKSIKSAMLENINNEEGYVLTFPSTGLKVKVKFEEYCRLHRIVTGLNPRSVWEMLNTNGGIKTVEDMIQDTSLSVGFRTWLNKWTVQLVEDFAVVFNRANEIYANRPTSTYSVVDQVPQGSVVTRKDLALYFTLPAHKEYSNILFALADNKNIAPLIWKRLRPAGGATFREDGGE